MRVAVTGTRGQVVTCLIERAASMGHEIVAVGRPRLDLACCKSIAPALRDAGPEVIVNVAAVTAVDDAEDDPEGTQAVNAIGAGSVAAAAASLGVPVIQISTDYVFDGCAGRAYSEDDQPRPLSVYGRSKLDGERLVAEANPHHLILRTAWVYSPFGVNFVTYVLRTASLESVLDVPSQQYGSPTSGLELADAILHTAARLRADDAERGVFHFAGLGSINRSGQARYILEVSRRLGGPFADVRDLAAGTASTRAPRPANSSLSSERFASNFKWFIRDWRESTEAVVAKVLAA